MAQQVEHVLGKDEVTGSNPVSSSMIIKIPRFKCGIFILQVNLKIQRLAAIIFMTVIVVHPHFAV